MHCEEGDCEGSMECVDEVCRMQKLYHSEAPESCADTHQLMGNVMREWGDCDEALEYFKVALKAKRAKLGKDHEVHIYLCSICLCQLRSMQISIRLG